MLVFGGLSFFAAGLWHAQVFGIADFCEQVDKINQNTQIANGIYPSVGTGIFYYIQCLTKVN